MFAINIGQSTDLGSLRVHDLDIKIIDFGSCEVLIDDQGERLCDGPRLDGTPMFYAPETLLRRVHSKATDIWQAGVTLYILLFQKYPFANDDATKSYRDGALVFPKIGGVVQVSETCKDLFSRIFTVDPERRITCEEILNHSWIRDYASLPDDDFGEDYRRSMKDLILRKQLRESIGRKVQRCNLIKTQFLDAIVHAQSAVLSFEITTTQFGNLKKSFLESIEYDGETSILLARGVDCAEFCRILASNGISVFANEEVFRIFDLDGGGTVDYFELFSVLGPYRENTYEGDIELQNCKLYFELFDCDLSGEISKYINVLINALLS